ncbi:MAG TPA: Clp protease N-terminal domain-containing protein, partial [Acidimicrobiales bacterium]|nr:Clp protease N-terminal domain-containing protein [Acidimicrobiales bacterium]
GSFGTGALERPTRRRSGRGRSMGPVFTRRLRKVVELSLREALALGHHYIGTEHLLLAVVREGDGVAAQILGTGTDLSGLRTKVLDEVSRRLRPGA